MYVGGDDGENYCALKTEPHHNWNALLRSSGLANGASGAHYWGMDDLESKIIDFLVAVSLAPIAALTLGYVAHYLFGLSRLDIRTSALTGAETLALIVALLLATEFFEKLRKSK
jgi:hypothetical protein